MTTKAPKKAFVLAAGFGTRMLPLTRVVPKALLPLWGKPMLQHTLEMLIRWGVEDVLVNAHHLAHEVFRFLHQYRHPKLKIEISYEPDILGTGGALHKAAWFLDDKPFWLINADVAADLSPNSLLSSFKHNTLAVLWMHPSRGPLTVAMDGNHIVDFRSSPSQTAHRTYTFCGLQLLSPRILDYLPNTGFAGIIPAYEQGMKQGEAVLGVCAKGAYWADVGRPEQYLQAHEEILECYESNRRGKRLFDIDTPVRMAKLRRQGIRIDGFAAVSQQAVIHRGAHVRNAVVWEGAQLLSKAQVERAIIGPHTRIDGKARYLALPADDSLEPYEQAAFRDLSWSPERTTFHALSPRGSARMFFRLSQGSRNAILIRYDPIREENTLYANHARVLDSIHVSVPRILHDQPTHCFTIMEDVGDDSLQTLVPRQSARRTDDLYERVIDQTLQLHEEGWRTAKRRRVTLCEPFGPKLWRWERELFLKNYVSDHLQAAPETIEQIRKELRGVGRALNSTQPVLLHRDLQSSNILVKQGQPYFIDFQGMRLGPAVYDLASLLCDPYVMLSREQQEHLLTRYTESSRRTKDAHDLFWLATVQRLAQAIGAYVRLGRLPGTSRFLRHIPPALDMMERALQQTESLEHLRDLVENQRARSD